MRDATTPIVTGVALFASGSDDRVARRPTDAARVVMSALLVIVTGITASIAHPSEASARDLVVELPAVVEPLWRAGYAAASVWAALLLLCASFRRRGTLVRNVLLATALAFAVAILAGRIVEGAWTDVGDTFAADGPPVFPAVVLAITTAALSAMSPYLTRPVRHIGACLIALQVMGALFLDVALPSHSLGGVAIGMGAAAVVQLCFGSPGGRPTLGRIQLALEGLGVEVRELQLAEMQRLGVVEYDGVDASGPIRVRVYGRDAWDAQLLTSVWRSLAYRNANTSIVLRRVQQVEHEAFVTLLAQRSGVAVQDVITAGSAGRGDALLVVRPVGVPLSQLDGPLDDEVVRAMWDSLRRLHAAGITHGRIDPARMTIDRDGPVFVDLSFATVAGSMQDQRTDEAQMLVTTAICAGVDRALESARAVLGEPGLAAVLPYLQPAALPPELVDRVRHTELDLDALSERTMNAAGAKPAERVRLRRVDRRSLINVALLLVAAFTLIVGISGLDWDKVADEFTDVDWWWMVFALVLAQLARATGAISTIGASNNPLPVLPTTAMQFAIAYINLAIPATAARVAANVRYFTRVGIPAAAAVAVGALESFGGFFVQILILLLIPLCSDANVDLSLDLGEANGIGTVVLIVVGIAAVAGAILLASPRLRARAGQAVRSSASVLRVLRSPSRVAMLIGGNLANQLLFAIAISATLRAFGEEAPLTSLLLINTIVSMFAGVLPIPGGIGVSEAGLTWGLTSIGISEPVALAVAIAYRCVSFYIPPVWGYFSYRWLERNGFL